MEREFRTTSAELRAEGNGRLRGHAAVFDVEADLGGFLESIKPGAFARAIRERQDVRALLNHNTDLVLGRTAAGTLTLAEDQVGLLFDCTLPDTQVARDLRTSVARGDINECSFGFIPRKQTWSRTKDADGNPIDRRELVDLDLFDVSVVTYPAYSQTSVSARSLWPDGVPSSITLRARIPKRIAGAVYVARLAPAVDPSLELARLRLKAELALLD
jgi:HK97 family phage prohead protease